MSPAALTRTPEPLIQDPDLFMAMEDLVLVARGLVEGTLQGQHRSPYIGFSSEFTSHRTYERGDDLRYVNWKVWARQDRLFVKQFDAETNMNVYLFLDATGSMATAHGPGNKWRYSARAAASLAHLALRFRDAPGLHILDNQVHYAVPPRAGPHQLAEIVAVLTQVKPAGTADLDLAMGQALEGCRQRGLVVLISDLFDQEDAILAGLDQVRFRGHDVLVIQVLDPWERVLPERGSYRFRDLETGRHLVVNLDDVREAYGRAVRAWTERFRRACEERGIDWLSCVTTDPLKDLLVEYLAKRAQVT